MDQLVGLYRQEIEAVKNHDIESMARIDRTLQRANTLRDSLLERLKLHKETHGCQPPLKPFGLPAAALNHFQPR